MQRPSDELINGDAKLVEQFCKIGISAVFNLTEPGEHPFCGCGLNAHSGLPYSPEKLMQRGIKHFNYSWPDMTAPSLSLLLDIVQVACREIVSGGKVAVHCHAGFGRTGIVIACILIVYKSMKGEDAVSLVREKRKGSVQTTTQYNCILAFEDYFELLKLVFPSNLSIHDCKTIDQTILDQQHFLTKEEIMSKEFRFRHKAFCIPLNFIRILLSQIRAHPISADNPESLPRNILFAFISQSSFGYKHQYLVQHVEENMEPLLKDFFHSMSSIINFSGAVASVPVDICSEDVQRLIHSANSNDYSAWASLGINSKIDDKECLMQKIIDLNSIISIWLHTRQDSIFSVSPKNSGKKLTSDVTNVSNCDPRHFLILLLEAFEKNETVTFSSSTSGVARGNVSNKDTARENNAFSAVGLDVPEKQRGDEGSVDPRVWSEAPRLEARSQIARLLRQNLSK